MDQEQEATLRQHEETIHNIALSVKDLCTALQNVTQIFVHYQEQLSHLNQSLRGLVELLSMNTTTLVAAIRRIEELEHKVDNSQLDWRSE